MIELTNESTEIFDLTMTFLTLILLLIRDSSSC